MKGGFSVNEIDFAEIKDIDDKSLIVIGLLGNNVYNEMPKIEEFLNKFGISLLMIYDGLRNINSHAILELKYNHRYITVDPKCIDKHYSDKEIDVLILLS